MLEIEKYDRLARPGILKVGKEIYGAIPDQPRQTFCLRKLSNLESDLWEHWSSLFFEPNHPSPIVDLAMLKELDFILVSLSPELLRVWVLPIE
jgi:hypothetical protein